MSRRKEITWEVDENGCWNCNSHCTDGHGYPHCGINYKTIKVCRVMYEKAYGRIPKGLCVLHKCDNRKCINPEHLFIGTKDDNNKDKMRKGRQSHYGPSLPGEKHGMAKLTEKQVIEIRNMEGLLHREIAEIYGIKKSQVSNIRLGISWKYLEKGAIK